MLGEYLQYLWGLYLGLSRDVTTCTALVRAGVEAVQCYAGYKLQVPMYTAVCPVWPQWARWLL